MSRGVPSNAGYDPAEERSRAGSYAASGRVNKNPLLERVLFPTQVKESFLQRNKHMANQKMELMAGEFAKRAMANMK